MTSTNRLMVLSRTGKTSTYSIIVGPATRNADTTGSGYFLRETPSGVVGAPAPRFTSRVQIQLPGSQITYSTHAARDIVLPVLIQADSADNLDTAIDELVSWCDPITSSELIRIDYTNSANRTRYISTSLIGGSDRMTVRYDEANAARVVLALRASDPYWSDGAPRTVTYDTFTDQATAFSAATAFSELAAPFDGSDLDTNTVVTTGDVAQWPTWQLDGPADSFYMLHSDGRWLSYTAAVADGVTVTITTRPGERSVVDSLGVSQWANIDARSEMFSISPGTADVSVKAQGDGVNTEARLLWSPQWLSG